MTKTLGTPTINPTAKPLPPHPFVLWLREQVKSNGDDLMESTIERYYKLSLPFIEWYEKNNPCLDEAVGTVKKFFARKKNGTMFYALKNYLQFLGVPEDALSTIRQKGYKNKSMRSKRFLQSKVLSEEEIHSLIAAAENDEELLAFLFLYDTATRRAEACSVLFGDVRFRSSRNPKHAEDLAQGIHGVVRIKGKGGVSRTVFLHKHTVDVIRRMHLADPWHPMDYLLRFTDRRSGSGFIDKTYKRVYQLFQQRGLSALGREVTPHFFRHSKATHLADNGARLSDIQSYLGHSDIRTTTIYVEISSHTSRQAFVNFSKEISQ